MCSSCKDKIFFFHLIFSKVLLVPQVEATSKVFGFLNFFRGPDRLGSAISCPGVLGFMVVELIQE